MGTDQQMDRTPRFEVGWLYDRWPDINIPYGGGRQGGISPSRQSPAVFLFTGDSGEQYGYKDHFDEDGVFWYSGEGQVGDMTMSKGNLAVAQHAKDARSLHVFLTVTKGKSGKVLGQRYMGEFMYVNHERMRGPDRDGNERTVIVFHLVPVKGLAEAEVAVSALEPEPRESPEPTSLTDLRARALNALQPREGDGGKQALRSLFQRSEAVRSYVLMRAQGACECCGQRAPFARADGSPYLEPHHIHRLSDGGLDHPGSVAALCPNCHREVHHGSHGKAKNELLRRRIADLESFVQP